MSTAKRDALNERRLELVSRILPFINDKLSSISQMRIRRDNTPVPGKKMAFKVEFFRDDAVVGTAICADLQRAVRHIKDEKVFRTRYRATSARAFDIDKNMLVYRYADTSSEVDRVVIDHGEPPTAVPAARFPKAHRQKSG